MPKKNKSDSNPLQKSWYGVNTGVQAMGETPEIFIFDEIGLFGVSAKEFINELNAIDAPVITIRINSPGGSVADGMSIYSAIRRHKAKIQISIEGTALSIASLIVCAGEPATAAPGSVLMLHSPWTMGEGNARELRKTADALDATQRGMITAYAEKTGLTDAEIILMLESETWLSADEAVEIGLCDHIEGELMAASSNRHLSQFEDFQVQTPTTTDEKNKNIMAAETERRTQIRNRFIGQLGTVENPKANRDLRLQAMMDRALDNPAVTPEMVGDEALAYLGALSEPTIDHASHAMGVHSELGITSGSHAATYGANAHHSDFVAAASDALAQRFGARVDEPHPAAADLRRMSVLSMAETILRQRGERTEMLSKSDLIHRATHATSDFPLLLKNSLGKILVGGYESEPASHSQWVKTTESPDFKEQSRISRSDAPELEKVLEAGEYTYGSFGERQEVFTIAKYGRLFRLSWEALVNDDLTAFSSLLAAFGASARRKESDLVYTGPSGLLTNPLMSDSTELFHTDHSNIITSTSDLSVDSLSEGRKLMRLQTGQNGGLLNIIPKFLIVPVELESAAEVLLAALAQPGQTNSGVPNVSWVRNLELVVEPRLDADDVNSVYLAASPTQADTFEISYLEGERGLFFEEKPGFESDDLTTKARLSFAVAPIDWRGLVKLTITPA